MSLLAIFLHVILGATPPDVDASIIFSSISLASMPDTADYSMTTTVEGVGPMIRASAHIVQMGSGQQWTEMTAAGRRIRVIRNGPRQQLIDVESGAVQEMSVPIEEPARFWQGLHQGRWSAPMRLDGDSWEMIDDRPSDSTIRQRRLHWSAGRQELTRLFAVGREGDTTEIAFSWTAIGGRKVPEAIRISGKKDSLKVKTILEFSAWSIPRSVPADLFRLRGE